MAMELVTDEVINKAQSGDQEAGINLILQEYKNYIYLNVKNYFIVGAEQKKIFYKRELLDF